MGGKAFSLCFLRQKMVKIRQNERAMLPDARDNCLMLIAQELTESK
jgi:hypothetical protein